MKVYFDFRDWWIGVFVDDYHWYFCVLTLVVRFGRGWKKEDIPFAKAMDAVDKLNKSDLRQFKEYVRSME